MGVVSGSGNMTETRTVRGVMVFRIVWSVVLSALSFSIISSGGREIGLQPAYAFLGAGVLPSAVVVLSYWVARRKALLLAGIHDVVVAVVFLQDVISVVAVNPDGAIALLILVPLWVFLAEGLLLLRRLSGAPS